MLTIPPLTVTEGPFKIVGSVDLEKKSVSINVVRASDGAPVEYTTLFPVTAVEAILAKKSAATVAAGSGYPVADGGGFWHSIENGKLRSVLGTLEKVGVMLAPYVVKEWPAIMSWAEKALVGTALAL